MFLEAVHLFRSHFLFKDPFFFPLYHKLFGANKISPGAGLSLLSGNLPLSEAITPLSGTSPLLPEATLSLSGVTPSLLGATRLFPGIIRALRGENLSRPPHKSFLTVGECPHKSSINNISDIIQHIIFKEVPYGRLSSRFGW